MEKHINEEMKNTDNLLANNINCYCSCGNSTGLIPNSLAKRFVKIGICYILTTDTIVEYFCCCLQPGQDIKKTSYKLMQEIDYIDVTKDKRVHRFNGQLWMFELPMHRTNGTRAVKFCNGMAEPTIEDVIEGTDIQVRDHIKEQTGIDILISK